MRSLKPIYLALGFVGACSLVNKFDPIGDVPATAGTGGGSGSTAGGEAGMGGSVAGTSSGGKGGTSGTTGEGGEAGTTDVGQPITGGVIVVGTDVGTGSAATHFVVLLDPLTGKEIKRTQTAAKVQAIAYEAARDLWFVFTAAPTEATGPLLVGTMTADGFAVQQTVPSLPKPTDQNTVAILNQRLLYRSTKHVGTASTTDDEFTLLDTSSKVTAIAKLDIPYQYSTVGSVGSPLRGATAGGRVFFLHHNPDSAANCVAGDAGPEQACTVYGSSLSIGAADKVTLTLSPTAITSLAQVDKDGSVPGIAIQPSGNTVVDVVPPRRNVSTDATVFRYNASTGGVASGGPLTFSLESATKHLDPTAPASIAGLSLDPCNDLLFAAELANTALLYGVPIGTTPAAPAPFDPNSQNGTSGTITYEPYSKTLLNTNNDISNPLFNGFQIGGTATAPTFTQRGKSMTAPWSPPSQLLPVIVAVKNPTSPPCN